MSTKIKATLIHNPTAGDGQHDAGDLIAILNDAGFQVRYQSTKKDWKEALKANADMIVAAGGDGTLGKVMREAAGSDTPVALLPLGTANNIGRSFRILGEVHEIVRAWRDATPVAVDLGTAAWNDEEVRFVEACGGGLFAAAISEGKEKIEEGAFYLGHEVDRALIFLREHFEEGKAVDWRVVVDDHDHSGEYYSVEVLNIRFAGPSVPLATGAEMSDGLLDVVLIGAAESERLIEYFRRRIDDAAAEMPELPVVRGRAVTLTPGAGPFRVDDEVVFTGGSRDGAATEVRLSSDAGAVKVLAPNLP